MLQDRHVGGPVMFGVCVPSSLSFLSLEKISNFLEISSQKILQEIHTGISFPENLDKSYRKFIEGFPFQEIQRNPSGNLYRDFLFRKSGEILQEIYRDFLFRKFGENLQ